MTDAIRRIIAILSLIFLLTLGSRVSYGIDLGNALDFGVISSNGNINLGTNSKSLALFVSDIEIGGQSITANNGSSITGDLIASPKGISLKKGASAISCITAGAKVKLAATAACAVDATGTNSEVTTVLPNAIADIGSFVTAAEAQPATNAITKPIKVKKQTMQMLTDTVSGLNVVTAPSVDVGPNATLQFN